MSRISRLVHAVSWRYALGELALIVAGILLALQIDAWRAAREGRVTEVTTLREIGTALALDLLDAEANLDSHQQGYTSALILDAHLGANRPFADSLNRHFGQVLGTTFFVPNTAAFETLKSRGLETVSNDSLRLRIANLYAQRYAYVAWLERGDYTHLMDHVWPYYVAHFDTFGVLSPSHPADYEALRRDGAFRGLLRGSASVKQFLAHEYSSLIRELHALMRDLDAEVQRLS